MTHRPITVLPDGRHLYADGHTYMPREGKARTYKKNKPDDPRALRFYGKWFLPIDTLPDDLRVMPVTRPDSDTLDHKASCFCEVCKRPAATELWRKRRQRELKS